MTARPLHEAVQQAEEAIGGGNYQLAVDTCRRVLGQFPEFATAHRLLGEALLQEGDFAGAERAFYETLQRDPQSSAAYTGLATVAEGRGDIDSALAHAQVAWEISPRRAELRDRVAGYAEQLFGKGGRLHLTRAALASLHFQAGRWSRAAAEAAVVVAEYPERVDVRLRMAEALWRRGSLTAAANACRAVLESAPSSVMALLMLADTERVQGNREAATQLLGQARQIDPDGVRAADLVTIGSSDLAEFMLPAGVPEFDDSIAAAEQERPRIAPAPDFIWSDTPAEPTRGTAGTAPPAPAEPVEATHEAEVKAEAADSGYDVSLPDDAEIEAARPQANAAHGYTSMLRSLEGEGLKPFSLEGEGSDAAPEAFELVDDASVVDEVFGLVSDQEIEAARPAAEQPHGFTSLLNSLDESGLAPFEIEGEPTDPTKPLSADAAAWEERAPTSAPEAEAASFASDITAGWDDIDAEIQRAIPSDEVMRGYTGQLRDLDEIGLQPFALDDDPAPTSAAAPETEPDQLELDDAYDGDLSFLDVDEIEHAPAESSPFTPDLTDGWTIIDDEIQNAIPSDTLAAGYTDEFRAIDLSGVEPFVVEGNLPEPEAADDPLKQAAEPVDQLISEDLVAGIDLWTADHVTGVEPEGVTEADLFVVAVSALDGAEATPDAALVVEPVDNADAASAGPVADETVVEEYVSTAAAREPQVSGDAVRMTIVHLGVDASLFARLRHNKARLIESGQLQGDLLLPGVEPPGPTLEMLEQMVAESPDDPEARRQFAAALLEASDGRRALVEYQWLFRHQVSFTEDDLANLARVAEDGREQRIAGNRLLGAVYRQAGDLGQSAGYYHQSLVAYRDDTEEEA